MMTDSKEYDVSPPRLLDGFILTGRREPRCLPMRAAGSHKSNAAQPRVTFAAFRFPGRLSSAWRSRILDMQYGMRAIESCQQAKISWRVK